MATTKTTSKVKAKPLDSEHEKNLALADQARKETLLKDLEIQEKEINLSRLQDARNTELSVDFYRGYFTFNCDVDEVAVEMFCSSFRRFSRLFPKAPITIELNSGGGSIIDGFAMFDELLRLRKEGHHITIRVRGNAASMACVLLQAADRREMGGNAFLMIHRASFGAMGSAYEVEDSLDFVKKLEGRIVDIFSERSGKGKKLFTDFFKQRKDLWFDAKEALDNGLVDAVV